MKELPLTQGRVALVDDEDFSYLSHWSWFFQKHGYATRNQYRNGKHKNIYLHRQLIHVPPKMQVDHINRNKLDCRKENLRICTKLENCHNIGLRKRNTSQFMGVDWLARNKKWRAQAWHKGRKFHLGQFPTAQEAALIYDKTVIKLRGPFAVTNQSLGLL